MGYIIKDIQMDKETGNVEILYMGKDGYVHHYQEYVEPYATEKGAKNYIERSYNWFIYEKIDDMSYIENKRYLHTLKIIKVGA